MADYSQYNALSLAYIGDSVYETYNRKCMVEKTDRKVQELHRLCSSRAKAAAQMRIIKELLPLLSEEEKHIYLRGRNAEVHTKAKNATVIEYHEATGFEALIGYLFLTKQESRMYELIDEGWKRVELRVEDLMN